MNLTTTIEESIATLRKCAAEIGDTNKRFGLPDDKRSRAPIFLNAAIRLEGLKELANQVIKNDPESTDPSNTYEQGMRDFQSKLRELIKPS